MQRMPCDSLERSVHSANQIGASQTWQTEQWIRLGGHANTDQAGIRLIVDLGFPIVDFVLLRDWQITLNAAFGVEEFNLCSCLDEAIGDLKLGLKFPSRHTFFLYCKELGERNVGLYGLRRICLDKG